MGSPVSEVERYGGPTGRNELLHRRRIGRTFAIAAHEVTVEQFLLFRNDHDYNRQYSREHDAPVNTVTWYQAAQYCNWLSEQEGLPEDQWCYDPPPSVCGWHAAVPGLFAADRLSSANRSGVGVRLPGLGDHKSLLTERRRALGEYAWYTENSQQRWMLPVGSLKPNDFGLFDMMGNAFEWCQDEPYCLPDRSPSCGRRRTGGCGS